MAGEKENQDSEFEIKPKMSATVVGAGPGGEALPFGKRNSGWILRTEDGEELRGRSGIRSRHAKPIPILKIGQVVEFTRHDFGPVNCIIEGRFFECVSPSKLKRLTLKNQSMKESD